MQVNDFDFELLDLGYQMQTEVIGALKLFLAFASSFQPRHVHNILVIMLGPHFKNLQLIGDYFGLELAM
jgi:hypothetical protein